MAYWNKANWKPSKASEEILKRAMEHIQSVPYQVSIRWVFYRLYQDGLYTNKDDYKTKLTPLASRARHSYWGGWHPQIVSDETRSITKYITEGYEPDPNIGDLIERAKHEAAAELEEARTAFQDYRYSAFYPIDPKYYQDYIVFVLFEARAMEQQFRHYTKGLPLCPFGGQPSIPYKYEIAKYIESEYMKYGKDVVVLYFGDADPAGKTIYETGKTDISGWTDVPVSFNYVGLTEEQATAFGVPPNFEKGGYQWEALTDGQAREIIESAIGEYFNSDAVSIAEREQRETEDAIEQAIAPYVDELKIL